MTQKAIMTLRKVDNRKFSAEVFFNGAKVLATAGQRAKAQANVEAKIRELGYDKPFPEWDVQEVDETGTTVQAASPDSNPFEAPGGGSTAPKASEPRLPNDQLLALYEKGKAAAGIVSGEKCRKPNWKAADAILKAEGFRGGMFNLKRVVYAIKMNAETTEG